MSPRTGRPRKDVTKNISMGLRISEETARKLKECADILEIPKATVIEKGIDLVHAKIKRETPV